MSSLAAIGLRTIDGGAASFADYVGQVVLVVNVASKCGLTPQYEALEQAYRRYLGDGFVVLGFPCNQFRAQEPGNDAEIAAFCSTTYDVTFPLFSKIAVNGDDRHPLYRQLLAEAPARIEPEGGGMRTKLADRGIEVPPDDIMWNFEKILIGRDGHVIGRFAPDIGVDQPPLSDAISAALAA